MHPNYILVSSQSTIQVISARVIQEVVVCTIQTIPSGVIASCWVTEKEWEQGNTAAILTGFAANIESVMASPKVEAASSGPALDPSGLQATDITFTVAYTPPGSRFPPATVDVVIPANQLLSSTVPTFGTVGAASRNDGGDGGTPGGPSQDTGVIAALSEVDAAYARLVAASGGSPTNVPG